ncbi:MAG: Histidine kinase protein [Patescibacteria group bacterium]|nr:Histidine kinase protein [Patescibacteria group bacterium]
MYFRLDYQNYIILFSAVVNLFFAGFIYLKGKRNLVNISYSIFTIGVVFWSLGMFMYRGTPDYGQVIFWSKFLYFASGSIPLSLLFFSLIFPDSKIKLNFLKIIFLFIIPAFFLIGSFIPGFIVKDIVIHRTSENEMFFGSGYNFWSFYLLFYFGASFYNLVRTYRRSKNIVKLQIKYILIGAVISVFFGALTNLVLPAIGNTSFGWLGQSFTIIMIAFATYAVVKFRLMNIRFFLTRGILYGLLVAMVATIFSLSVLMTASLFGTENQASRVAVSIVVSFIIVIFLDPVKSIFARITDKIFYKDRIDYQKLLQQASAVVSREIDLSKLAYSLSDLLATQLKVKEISAWIIKDQNWHCIASSIKNSKSFELSKELIKLIQDHQDIIVVEELIRNQNNLNFNIPYYQTLGLLIKEAESIGVEMVVPVYDEKKAMTAIFLFSAKSSGDLYNQDDINFLNVLTPQIATAIEKSKLYEEVQALNLELQAKVDARTKSLKEANLGLEQRNKFLIAMQGVTNMVSRTMDLKQVNQLIANSIATEFGYIGGILTFIDEKNNVLRIGAMTENEYSNEVVKILGQDPKNFVAEMQMKDLLGVKTVLSGQMNTSDKMSDFFSPPVEKAVIDQIQEKLGVKTIVGLPIFSEDKIIGIVHFLLAVEESKFTSLDRDTMIALADQIGIVSRNLRLYNNLQATNQDLQVANMRLRELDQAKSEFLSIASHQLRTPISALKGYLSMISDGDFGTVPPKISKVVKDLFESAARLARLVNIFLNVSRIESGRLKIEKKPLQIGDMIESVIAELHNESDKKGVKLIYKKPKPALALVAADADKLREVVLNLIDNSIKYTPKGQIEVSALVENDNMHFKVQDTGIGIDPEEAKNLFRKFVRASGAAQIHTGGSGLGLFIAQKIIKEHGGQIWVESAGKEQGSIFQFVIPMLGGEPNKEEMQS